MKICFMLMCAALLGVLVMGNNAAAEVNVGDPSPDFVMAGSDGKTHKRSDYTGKQAVVIAWFPKAFTGG
jgi:peroxiredoxin Q/BCP